MLQRCMAKISPNVFYQRGSSNFHPQWNLFLRGESTASKVFAELDSLHAWAIEMENHFLLDQLEICNGTAMRQQLGKIIEEQIDYQKYQEQSNSTKKYIQFLLAQTLHVAMVMKGMRPQNTITKEYMVYPAGIMYARCVTVKKAFLTYPNALFSNETELARVLEPAFNEINALLAKKSYISRKRSVVTDDPSLIKVTAKWYFNLANYHAADNPNLSHVLLVYLKELSKNNPSHPELHYYLNQFPSFVADNDKLVTNPFTTFTQERKTNTGIDVEMKLMPPPAHLK